MSHNLPPCFNESFLRTNQVLNIVLVHAGVTKEVEGLAPSLRGIINNEERKYSTNANYLNYSSSLRLKGLPPLV